MNDNQIPAESGRFQVVRVLPRAIHAAPRMRPAGIPYASRLPGETGANAGGRLWSGALLFWLLQGALAVPLVVPAIALESILGFLLLPSATALPAAWLVCHYVARADTRDHTLGCTAAVVGSLFWGVPAVICLIVVSGMTDGPVLLVQVPVIAFAAGMLLLAMNLPGVAIGSLFGCRHAKSCAVARQRRIRKARWQPTSIPHLLTTCRGHRHG